MNLLFFTHEKAYGGASRALVTLIEELERDKEIHIYVVVPFRNSRIVQELKKRKVTIITCFYSWWEYPMNVSLMVKFLYKILYKFNFIAYWRLKRKIGKLDIDVIHSNSSVIDIGAKVARGLGIKHIWHFREFTFTHLNFIKSREEAFGFINQNTDGIIYISLAIKEFYEQYLNPKLGFLVYDGVKVSDFKRKKEKKKGKCVQFLLVATLEENKGQLVAIKAVSELRRRGIYNFKLTLVCL